MPGPVGLVRRRAGRSARWLTLLSAAALLAAGCSSGGDAQAGTTALPGIDGETAKVGLLISDVSSIKGSMGLDQADYGDPALVSKGIEAIVDHINADGAGGRQIDAQIVPFNGGESTPEQTQKLCADLTQDRGVFAAIVDGQYHSNMVPCYAGANTLVFDLTAVAHDQAQFEQHDPYLWAPSFPEYGTFFAKEMDVLIDEGFVEAGHRVQLLTADADVARRTAENVAKPMLTELGVSHVQTDYIDGTNVGTIGASAKSAIQSGKSGDIDRVIAIGGARALPIALSDFEARDYEVLMSMSSFDSPVFIETNSVALQANRRPGMVGVGYNPSADVNDTQGPAFPDSDNPTQVLCHDIVTAADAAPPAAEDGSEIRENWKLILHYCDALLVIDAALDNLGDTDSLTAADFADGAAQIGGSLPSAISFGSHWSEGVRAGVNTVRKIRWDEDCDCFDYFGEVLELDPATGS